MSISLARLLPIPLPLVDPVVPIKIPFPLLFAPLEFIPLRLNVLSLLLIFLDEPELGPEKVVVSIKEAVRIARRALARRVRNKQKTTAPKPAKTPKTTASETVNMVGPSVFLSSTRPQGVSIGLIPDVGLTLLLILEELEKASMVMMLSENVLTVVVVVVVVIGAAVVRVGFTVFVGGMMTGLVVEEAGRDRPPPPPPPIEVEAAAMGPSSLLDS